MHRRFHDKYFDRGLRGWIIKYAKKNYWRVASWYDLEDLIQDGLLAYALCRQKYGHRVENRRHFMSLVQVVFANHVTDLANARTKSVQEISISQIAAQGRELQALEYLAGAEDGGQELKAALSLASEEILAFLKLFETPEGLAELDKPLRRRADGTRETWDERLSLILRMPVDDINEKLRNLLGAAA